MGNRFLNIKKKYLVKKGFRDSWVFKYLLKYLYPKESSKFYNYYKRIISKALLNISVEDLWSIKLGFSIIVVIFIVMIFKTNLYYKAEELAVSLADKSSMVFVTNKDDQAEFEKNKKKQEYERKTFDSIKNKFKFEIISKDPANGVTEIAEYIEFSDLKSEDEASEDIARRMYKKLEKYSDLQKTDYFLPIFLFTIAFFIPDGYLMLRSFLVKYYIYNEYLKLEVTAIMVGKLEPIKVEEILNVLSDNSKFFKIYIDEIRFNYFNVKDGNSKAFDSVISKVAHKELRYLLKALQQAAESDLKMTIENLENQRKSNKEFRNIKEQSKLKQKELIAILVILIMLAVVCFYALAPFPQMMSNYSVL